MNLGQAFSFPFQDPDWLKKIGLMALISLIPIVGPIIVLGWGLDITRRVITRSPIILPEIDMGNQITDGLKAFVVSFVYALPIIILQIPISILSVVMDTSSDVNTSAYLAVTVCCGGLMLLYLLFMIFILPAALGNLAAKGNLRDAFDFTTVLGLVRAAPGAYVMVVLGIIAGSFVGSLGIIVCVIGVILTNIYVTAVIYNLYGQAYNEATRNKQFSSQTTL